MKLSRRMKNRKCFLIFTYFIRFNNLFSPTIRNTRSTKWHYRIFQWSYSIINQTFIFIWYDEQTFCSFIFIDVTNDGTCKTEILLEKQLSNVNPFSSINKNISVFLLLPQLPPYLCFLCLRMSEFYLIFDYRNATFLCQYTFSMLQSLVSFSDWRLNDT
jgi:hypothetical protein